MTVLVTMGVLLVVAVLSYQLHATRQREERERTLREFFASRRSAAPAPGWSAPAGAASSGGGSVTLDSGTRVEVTRSVATIEDPPARGRFTVESSSGLPTFADVGGMEQLKAELRDTIGLILAHDQKAQTYGIRWNGLLLHGPPGTGKTFIARAVAGEFRLNLLHVSTGDLVEGVMGQSAQNVQQLFATAAANRPCLVLFDEFDSLAQRRAEANPEERRTVNMLLTSIEEHRDLHDLIVVAATNDLDELDPATVRPGRFDRHVRVDLPDRAARRAVLAAQLADRPACDGVDLDELATRTEGLTPAALAQAVDAAALIAFREATGAGALVRITHDHLRDALAAQGGQDRPLVEDWDWDHLVLPADTKDELQQLQALVEDPDLADRYGVAPPTGVLLAGPPGTGKTTIARVLAAQARCSFYLISAADVTSKFVGESEGNIRRLFDRARANRPSIVFIDEIDALGAVRTSSGDDAAARLLNQLLVEIDGVTGSRGVLVVGATNRPDMLDPALTRGGRLSRTIDLPLPDVAARRAILQMAMARMPTVGVDVDDLAARTDGLSGADLKAVCQQAALLALVRARRHGQSQVGPAILTDDFLRAIADR